MSLKVETFAFNMIGHLGHKNKLFDLKCAGCTKIASSENNNNGRCPKCGDVLEILTTKQGIPMAVSEGTIYPLLTDKCKKKDEELALSFGGALPVYRFAMYSFGDANGSLAPPPLHDQLVSGTPVQFKTRNHQFDIKPFASGNGQLRAQIRVRIRPSDGDTFRIVPKAEMDKIFEEMRRQPSTPTSIPTQTQVASSIPSTKHVMDQKTEQLIEQQIMSPEYQHKMNVPITDAELNDYINMMDNEDVFASE
jgi:hypothetical protein